MGEAEAEPACNRAAGGVWVRVPIKIVCLCLSAVEGCSDGPDPVCEERCEDGGYGTCLVLLGGVWEHIVKWRTHMFTVFTPFFTLGPGSTTLYSTHALSHGLISSTTFLQHSTTLYSLQLYSSSTVQNHHNTPLGR